MVQSLLSPPAEDKVDRLSHPTEGYGAMPTSATGRRCRKADMYYLQTTLSGAAARQLTPFLCLSNTALSFSDDEEIGAWN